MKCVLNVSEKNSININDRKNLDFCFLPEIVASDFTFQNTKRQHVVFGAEEKM